MPLALLAALYPVTAWRDAPLFPTPRDALHGLARLLPLRDGASIVDAGCGLGHALKALQREYPRAHLVGLEWSWPIQMACSWRLGRAASVSRADIWRADWSAYDLVYLFQRPESMPRAADKAGRELRPGAWLASLEFAVPSLSAQRVLSCPDGRSVWLYQAPFRRR
jgi:trans-aconitate methyltransferase